MSKKSSKIQPQQHKSPEELKKEHESIVEANRQRKLVVEKMYPFLLKNCKNIAETNQFLTICKMAVEQSFMNQRLTQSVDEIGVLKGINMADPRGAAYKEFITLFQYEKVKTSIDLIEGMGHAIDSFIREELTKRPLDTLKTDFLPVDPKLEPKTEEKNGELQK